MTISKHSNQVIVLFKLNKDYQRNSSVYPLTVAVMKPSVQYFSTKYTCNGNAEIIFNPNKIMPLVKEGLCNVRREFIFYVFQRIFFCFEEVKERDLKFLVIVVKNRCQKGHFMN